MRNRDVDCRGLGLCASALILFTSNMPEARFDQVCEASIMIPYLVPNKALFYTACPQASVFVLRNI